ncbi:Rrf2 family transcriptional regulator [Bradyrhizobium tropiciagri]|nr:Rrf2 family transcriptional regulator [Bradyrhizobium tropiciagri]MBR0873307.1 Rrf2 family transcriptional regulator [Bradyrhizobium tropiciagri]
MAHLGNGVEYGLHCLLWLVDAGTEAASSRDLADLQGISPSFLAKIFPKLEKAGIVRASEGIRGGYLLARPADQITVLDVVDAIEGKKPLFDCQQIRRKCAVFGRTAPRWSSEGVCAIHAVMLRAEQSMRTELANTTIAALAGAVDRKAPANFAGEVREWLSRRVDMRETARRTGTTEAKTARSRAS